MSPHARRGRLPSSIVTGLVIGLVAGLAARAAVDFYHHLRAQGTITPPTAAASPPMIKAERIK